MALFELDQYRTLERIFMNVSCGVAIGLQKQFCRLDVHGQRLQLTTDMKASLRNEIATFTGVDCWMFAL
jgi:hypothetical protein